MKPRYDVEVRANVKTPMRDGTNLSADIYLPRAQGTFPTVLVRTPYSNNLDQHIEKGRRLANDGYIFVVQDTRGRWDSDGDYYPVFEEAEDGYDIQEWIGQQEWSNGKIGMSGGSYLGLVQWHSAQLRSQYLTCLAPRVIACDFYDSWYPGGALNLNVAIAWAMRTSGRAVQNVDHHNWTEMYHYLPLMDLDDYGGFGLGFWKDWIRHAAKDEYWKKGSLEDRFGEISVPAFNLGGWYDVFAGQTFINFNGMKLGGGTPESRQSKLIVGPWIHSLSVSQKTGDVDFGTNSMVDLDDLELRWFDHWLKGIDTGILDEPPLRLFIMGINQWRDEHEWPLARTDWQKWYLHSGGNANTVLGDGALSSQAPAEEPVDGFTYDPGFPVPTMGGNTCCYPHIVPWGPDDQRPIEMRSDVLCYTSDPLEADLEVTGPIKVVLYAATDGLDTDWTAKLVDVSAGGYAMNLCDGIIRARYRESTSEPSLLESNAIYEYEIDLAVTGNVFRKGHQIRVEVSSSNFPRFDRNLNTGHDIGMDAEMRQANQTLHHSRSYPSHILLPVIPSS